MKQTKLNILLYFLKTYRWQTLLLLFVQFSVGFLEGLGIMALLPLITLITDGLGQSNSQLSLIFSQFFEMLSVELNLTNVLLFIAVIFILKAFLRYLGALYTSHLSAKIVYDFRSQFLEAIFHSRWSFYTDKPVGTFLNALFSEAQRSGGTFKSFADIAASVLQIIILLSIAAISSWEVVVLGVIASIFLWFVLIRFVRITGKTGIKQKDLSISINTQIADVLQNFKPLKAMNIENVVYKKILGDIHELFRITKEQMMAKQNLGILHEPVFITIMCFGLYGAIVWLDMESSVLMVMAALFYRVISSGKALQQSYQVLCGKESFFWSLMDFTEKAREGAEHFTQGQSPVFEKDIELKNVDFDYGDKEILKSLNLYLPVNNLIGLLGPSGTGKTTIVDLLCGLYTPKSGSVLIDGVNLNDINISSWRQNIGYVPQEFVIFNDNIIGNLILGDETLTEEDAIEALKQAEAWDFVKELPDKLYTNLGERGSRLSGGQRQRISIARALIRKPKLLILDEATASLDPKTEKEIFVTLKKLAKSTTIVAISHQNTIKQEADLIIDLGKVP